MLQEKKNVFSIFYLFRGTCTTAHVKYYLRRSTILNLKLIYLMLKNPSLLVTSMRYALLVGPSIGCWLLVPSMGTGSADGPE